MKRYLLFISVIITNLFLLFGCGPDQKVKPYKLRIYVADKALQTGSPVSQEIIRLFYPIEVNDTLAFNANDAVGKQSPFLIRLDNNYQESMTVELDEVVRDDPKSLLIKDNIDAKFKGDNAYVVTKKLGDNYGTINISKIDSLLDTFPKKQGVFIYSVNSEMPEYKGFKVINNIDSLQYAIGQKLLENSSQEINVLYGVDLSVKAVEPPPIITKLDSTQTSIGSNLGIDWAQYARDSIEISKGGKPCREDFNDALQRIRLSYYLYSQERSERIKSNITELERRLLDIKNTCK